MKIGRRTLIAVTAVLAIALTTYVLLQFHGSSGESGGKSKTGGGLTITSNTTSITTNMTDFILYPWRYNNLYVSLKGVASTYPLYDPESDLWYFELNISTTSHKYSIEVIIDPSITSQLETIPLPGDNVSVTGLHKYLFNKSHIVLREPGNLTISYREDYIEYRNSSFIKPYTPILVQGVFLDYVIGASEYYLLLDSKFKLLNVTVPNILRTKYGLLENEDVFLGHNVSVRGVYVGGYTGLVVRDLKDLSDYGLVSTGNASLADLNEYVGRGVRVTGILGEIIDYNDTAITTLLYSSDSVVKLHAPLNYFLEKLDPLHEGVGSKVLVVGRVLDPVSLNAEYMVVLEKYPAPVIDPIQFNYTITGYIVGVRGLVSGHHDLGDQIVYYLSVEDNVVEVHIPKSILELVSLVKNNMTLGNYVLVYGVLVENSRGYALKVLSPKWIRSGEIGAPGESLSIPRLPLPRGIYGNVSLSSLDSIAPGSRIGLVVGVSSIQYYGGNYYILLVNDYSGRGYVLMSSGIMEHIDPYMLGFNATIYVYGVIDLDPSYGSVVYASLIKIVEPSQPFKTDLCSIGGSMVGEMVILDNVLVESINETGGYVYMVISSGNCSFKAVIPIDVYEELPPGLIETGSKLTLCGFVETVEGEQVLWIYSVMGITVYSG